MTAYTRAPSLLAGLIWIAFPLIGAAQVNFIAELQRPGATDGNLFGKSVAVDGNWAAVGSQTPFYYLAPSNVYGYNFSDPTNIVRRTFVNPAAQVGQANKFGQSVAVQGSLLFVGDPEPASTQPGVVHVYDLKSSSAMPFLTIHAFDEARYSAFGTSLAVDGTRLAVGATKSSGIGTLPPAVYILEIGDLNNIQQFKVSGSTSNFGEAIDLDGNFLIAGARDEGVAGAAYLYDMSDPLQILSKRLTPYDPNVTDSFGSSVAISGRKALVSAEGDLGPIDAPGSDTGVAYLHDFSNWNSIEQIEFTGDDTVNGDGFGDSSGIDLVGNLAVVGAKPAKSSSGSVYVFDVSDPQDINQLRKIQLQGASTGDLFGSRLATDGQSLVITSLRGNNGGGGAMPGRAYLFAIPEPSALTLCGAALSVALAARKSKHVWRQAGTDHRT
jgi:hypothetical protein